MRVWRSKTPLVPGSFVGGKVAFNLTRDCKFCGKATASGGCRAPNSCARCGGGDNGAGGDGGTSDTTAHERYSVVAMRSTV